MVRTRSSNSDQVTHLPDRALYGFEAKETRLILSLVGAVVILLTVLTIVYHFRTAGLVSPSHHAEKRTQSSTRDGAKRANTQKPEYAYTNDGDATFKDAHQKSAPGEGVPRRGEPGAPTTRKGADDFSLEDQYLQKVVDRVDELLVNVVRMTAKHAKTDSEEPRRTGSEPDASAFDDTQSDAGGEESPHGGRELGGKDATGNGTGAEPPPGRDRDTDEKPGASQMPGQNRTDAPTDDGHRSGTGNFTDSDGQCDGSHRPVPLVWRYLTVIAEAVWSFCLDPLGKVVAACDWFTDGLREHLGITSKYLGMLLLIVLINFLGMLLIRLMDFFGGLWRLLKLLCYLPMFVLMRRTWNLMTGSMMNMAKSLKGDAARTRKINVKEEVQKLKDQFREMREANEAADVAGLKAEIESFRTANETLKNEIESVRDARVVEMIKELGSVNAVEVLKSIYGKTLGKGQANAKKLWAKGYIDGIEFPKCLIDTGSEVNMLSEEMAVNHGFAFRTTNVKGVRGFSSQVYSKVLGEMDATLRFGPGGKVRPAKFYVVGNCPSPLIGLPTLRDFGIVIDTTENLMRETETGLVIMCAVADVRVKKQKSDKKEGEKDDASSSKTGQKN